ncbi:MAG: hypothetical protein U9Q62_10295 [Campylobacterota bacterium]|nr:hypothetical protein [Campylobacterota bacterium]
MGQCAPHIKGKAEQRKVAILRAINELALQQSVSVDSSMVMEIERSGMMAKSKSKSEAFLSADGVVVHAHIEEVWIDPKDETLYVWMIKD